MRSSQLTGILHVAPKVPELLQANFGNIYDVVRLIDRCLRVRSSGDSGTQGHDKARQILIQGEEA